MTGQYPHSARAQDRGTLIEPQDRCLRSGLAVPVLAGTFSGVMLALAQPFGIHDSMTRYAGPEPAVTSSSGIAPSPFSSYANERLPAQSRDSEPQPHILTSLPPEQQSTAGKLQFVVAALGGQFQPGSLGLVQVWTSRLGRKWSGVSRQHANKTVLDTHLNAYVVDNPKLQDFRDQSCQQGITGTGLGMLGKVWSTGALQVVQQVGIIPHSVHPRNKLQGDSLEAVAEVVYIPVYVKTAPEAGVQAVVEVVVSSSIREAMVVANLISFVSETLSDLKLSLYKPERLQRVGENGTLSTQSSLKSDGEAPKRSMSRSGSSRVLSSFGDLSLADKPTDLPPKPTSRVGTIAAKQAAEQSRKNSIGPSDVFPMHRHTE